MDRKGGIWVKNMCQKIEAVCQDLDEFVCKDPVLYVGNQIQTVSESVKKFYSDVMQDFLVPLVDPAQHIAQLFPSKCIDLGETSGSSVVDCKENTLDSNTSKPKEAPLVPKCCYKSSTSGLHHSEQITCEISGPHEDGIYCNASSESDASVFEDADWGIESIIDLDFDTEEKIEGEPLMKLKEKETLLNSSISEFECDSSTHQSSELESSITCSENKEENAVQTESVDYFSVSSHGLSSCGSFTALGCDNNNDTTRTDGLCTTEHGENCTLEQFEASVSWSEIGVADGSTFDFEDVKMDTVDLSDNKQLVESCVMVESFSDNSGRSKSYKKRIQDAFMLRKRLTKEYKQLTVLYGDINKECSQPKEENKVPNIGATDFPDSEWELL